MESKKLRCIKGFMLIITLLILVSGILLLSVGAWVYANEESFPRLLSGGPRIINGIAVIIAIGGILIFVGIIGCIGTIANSKCLLATFCFTIIILFIIQIIAITLIFAFYNQNVRVILHECGQDELCKHHWEAIQSTYHCCGYDKGDDWGKKLPSSCCRSGAMQCTYDSVDAYKEGCKDVISHYSRVVVGIAIAVIVVEIFAMIFTTILLLSPDAKYEAV